MRFKLDISGEIIQVLHLLKLWHFYCLYPSQNQLLFNISGNPRASKSILMKLCKNAFGDSAKEGNLTHTNPFQVKDLLLNTTQVLFPDSNPSNLTKSNIDFLKRLTGGDAITGEEKFGQLLQIKGHYTVTIVNNENYEAVQAYKEPAMADRAVNIQLPSITSEAALNDLEKYLENDQPYFWLSSLSINTDLINCTTRGREINAAMGTGSELPLIEYIQKHLVFTPDKSTEAKLIYNDYHKFLSTYSTDKGFIVKNTYKTPASFNQSLKWALDRMDKKGVVKNRTKHGTAFRHIELGDSSKVNDNTKKFNYTSAIDSNLLKENPFLLKTVKFVNEQGNFEEGPRLDPHQNIQIFKIIGAVQRQTIKELVTGKPIKTIHGRHFEETGFGGSDIISVETLNATDFIEQEQVEYQSKLFKLETAIDDFPNKSEINFTTLTPLLLGVDCPFFIHPFAENIKSGMFFKPSNIISGTKIFDFQNLGKPQTEVFESFLNQAIQSTTIGKVPKLLLFDPKSVQHEKDSFSLQTTSKDDYQLDSLDFTESDSQLDSLDFSESDSG